MNKKEAAEYLGVSTRLVEKYASEGRMGEVTYVRGRTGKQPWKNNFEQRKRLQSSSPFLLNTFVLGVNKGVNAYF